MNSQGKKEEYTLSWAELSRCSEMGIIKNIRTLFKLNNFPIEAMDASWRKCISKFNINKKNYCDSIIELIKHCDLNYVNPKFENSNLIMCACAKGDKFIIQQIWDKNLNKGEVDWTRLDANKLNCFHYILYKNDYEEYSIEIMQLWWEYNKRSKIYKISNEELLEQADNKGNSVVNLILLKGWSKMLRLYYEYTKYKKYIIPDSNNNFIHCAVLGNNISCLKWMLNYCTMEDLKLKNKEGYTPQLWANKRKFYFPAKIIESFESNFNNKIFKMLMLKSPLESTEILAAYHKQDYQEALNWLNRYKLNQSIIGDVTNWPCEWNIILSKRNSVIIRGITQEQILSKFKNDKENNNNNKKQIPSTTWNELSKFFTKTLNNEHSISSHNDEESYPIDIVLYNRIIFYLKIGNIPEVYKYIYYYLRYIRVQNPLHYLKFLTYCNITVLWIELLIKNNWFNLSWLLIENYWSYWFINFKNNKKWYYSGDIHEQILTFFNDNEILHPFSPTWDEHFSYWNILKSWCDIENSKQYFTDYKNLVRNCDYLSDVKVFNRLDSVYLYIKTKIHYNYGNCWKTYDKLNTTRKAFNTWSNDQKLFYYNSWGIWSWKQKNYLHAEYMFRVGIKIFKCEYENANFGRNTATGYKSEGWSIPKFNYLCNMKFNLALSLFYQRRYSESNALLSKWCDFKILNNNIFWWYRLGLSYWEMHWSKSRELIGNEREIVRDNKGYSRVENESEGCVNNEEDEDENKDIYEELYAEFEKEYGYELKVNPFNVPNSSNGIKSGNNAAKSVNDITNDLQRKSNLFHKRLFLSASKPAKTSTTHMHSDHSVYLNQAINAFRSLISLSSNPVNITTGSTWKKIYQWYSKNTIGNDSISLAQGSNQSKANNTPEHEEEQVKAWLTCNLNPNIILSGKWNWWFCLSLGRKWVELWYWVSKMTKQKLATDVLIKINYFKIEALIGLKRWAEAKTIISEWFGKHQNENVKIDAYHQVTMNKVRDLHFKIGWNCGLILILCKEKKYSEAEVKIKYIIDTYYKGKEEETPQYIINIFIYTMLCQGEKGRNRALNLIKTRNMRTALLSIENKK